MAKIDSVAVKLKDGRRATIRSASEEDAAELLSCMRRVLDDGEGVVLLPSELRRTEEKQRDWIRSLNEGAQSLALVAQVDGRIVGSLDFQTPAGERFAHTGSFAMTLLPEFRGQGLGAGILSAMIEWARSIPRLEKINLLVLGSNARAIALYRKFGFVEEGRKRREVRLRDGVYEDNVLMTLFVR